MPTVIGVSAHRNITEEALPAVESAVANVLSELKGVYPSLIMLNDLAQCGDMLCGQHAVKAGIKLSIALPAEESGYLNPTDFTEQSRKEYAEIMNSGMVIDKFVVPAEVKTGDRRFDGFYNQTLYVVKNCSVLLVLWDGTECKDINAECGTNAAVALAIKHGKPIIAIFVPRNGRTYPANKKAGDVRYISASGADCDGISELGIQ